MKSKNIVSIVLLVFVGVSIAYLVVSESRSPANAERGDQETPTAQAPSAAPEAASAPVAGEGQETGPRMIAYYFHRTQRCRTCLAMEEYAVEALHVAFPEAFESGDLEWHAINIEEPEYEHFVQDYELTSSAMVMVRFENGAQLEWKNLEDIWDLVSDKLEFQGYVEGEALAYLESGS